MSCVLRIFGDKFDVDNFVDKTRLKPYSIYKKGQPAFKTKPKGRKLSSSGLCIDTSKADFDNLDAQIKDTIKFLKKTRQQLISIKKDKTITEATLDFGINSRMEQDGILCQSDSFPSELLKLAGDLSIDICLSQYPVNSDFFEKKFKKLTKNKKINKA